MMPRRKSEATAALNVAFGKSLGFVQKVTQLGSDVRAPGGAVAAFTVNLRGELCTFFCNIADRWPLREGKLLLLC